MYVETTACRLTLLEAVAVAPVLPFCALTAGPILMKFVVEVGT